jgi:hypothetical protein
MPGAVTDLSQGCHSYPFFVAQEPHRWRSSAVT